MSLPFNCGSTLPTAWGMLNSISYLAWIVKMAHATYENIVYTRTCQLTSNEYLKIWPLMARKNLQNIQLLEICYMQTAQKLGHTLAAPVELGMIFWPAPRPPRQSLPEGPSTVFWVADKTHKKLFNQYILAKNKYL